MRTNHPQDAVALSPITGPTCWTGDELRERGDWLIELTPKERSALRAALAMSDGRDALALKADDFPLGDLADSIAAMRGEAVSGRGFAMLRTGFDDLDEPSARRLVWGLGQHIGVPQKQDGAGTLLHDIRDTGASYENQSDIRIYQTNLRQPFHNDGADLFMLLCRRQASDGGGSIIVSAHTVFNEVLKRRPDLARVLTEPFHFDARGQQLPGRPWVQTIPVYHMHKGNWFIIHKRHYIETAQRDPAIPRLSGAQIEALDLMDALCDDPALHMEFFMSPGDIVLGSNHATLHSRAAFKDPGGNDAGKRHMLRLWLGVDGGPALPPCFRDTREFGTLFETTRRQ